jgi:hypothetical protein
MVGCGPVRERVCLRRLLAARLRPALFVIEVLTPALNQAGDHYQEEDWLDGSRLNAAEFSAARNYQSDPTRLLRSWCRSRCLAGTYSRAELRHGLELDDRRSRTGREGVDYRPDAHGWLERQPARTAEERCRYADLAQRQYGECFGEYHLAGGPARALHDLLDRCSRAGIPAALVLMPEASEFRALYPQPVREGIERFVSDLGREKGVPVIDARTWVEDSGFWDGHHLVAEGAAVFTERFGREALPPLLRTLPCRP